MPNLMRMRIRMVGTRGRVALAALGLALACALALASASRADEVSDFRGGWADRALQAQYELGSDVGFKNAPLIGTHNSFNSQAEMGAGVTAEEANQELGLTAQLDSDVRALEIDLHREPNGSGEDDRPVVCHTLPQQGCVVVRDLDPFLAEIGDWLREPANSGQVILLYLEDDLDDLGLHDAAAGIIENELGDLVYEPEGQGCVEVPSDLTRDDVRAAGRQVVIVSGCGKGGAWHSLAFSWERHLESRPHGFEDFPGCGPDYSGDEYRVNLVRYFEDSTRAGLNGADDGLTPETTAAMARCGVDLFGFDRLEPLDGRLEGAVWSWAPNEPSTGRCALIRAGEKLPFGRWVSEPCGEVRARPVCRHRRDWIVGKSALDPHGAVRWCRRNDAELAVPRTGNENQLVRLAMAKRHAKVAQLGYRLRGGTWTPLDERGD